MDRRAYSQENRNKRADSVAKTVVISPKAEAETPNPTGIKGLFEGLSVSQVTAGALAAVTSMLLSAQIGIAGSVIGVAVGSVVSTVSSQLYKNSWRGQPKNFAASPRATTRKKMRRLTPLPPKAQPKASHTRKPPLCPSHAHHSRVPKPPRCLRWARRRAHSTKRGPVGQFRRNVRSIRGPNRWTRCTRHARQPSRSRRPIEYAAHQ